MSLFSQISSFKLLFSQFTQHILFLRNVGFQLFNPLRERKGYVIKEWTSDSPRFSAENFFPDKILLTISFCLKCLPLLVLGTVCHFSSHPGSVHRRRKCAWQFWSGASKEIPLSSLLDLHLPVCESSIKQGCFL